jgi:hypothetical protein
MAAAKVMRGEATMADITYDPSAEKDYYGSCHPEARSAWRRSAAWPTTATT